MRRFWETHRNVFEKEFLGQAFQSNFVIRHIEEFTKLIDDWIEADGALVKNFIVTEIFDHLTEEETITFTKYYDELIDWSLSQKDISLDHLEEIGLKRKSEVDKEKFKKETDNYLI